MNQSASISAVIVTVFQKFAYHMTTEGNSNTVLPKRFNLEEEWEFGFRKEGQDRYVLNDLLNVFETQFVDCFMNGGNSAFMRLEEFNLVHYL